VDEAVTGDESVAVDDLVLHTEVVRAVADQLAGFCESVFVEQQVDALAGGEFALLVLAGAAFLATSGIGRGVAAAEFFEAV